MRAILTIVAAVLVTAAATADDKTAARERRVRVALALSAGEAKPAVAADCGKCREDAVAARLDGLKEGKPVVLFVGGCPHGDLADATMKGGGIPVKVSEYRDDVHPNPAERRVVVLEPTADRKGFVRLDLPAGVSAKDLEAATRASVPKAVVQVPSAVQPAALNWQF